MKRIGIDMDGTIADYMKTAVPMLRDTYGIEPDYNMQAYTLEEVFGLTTETRPADMRQRLYVEGNLFRHLSKLEEDNNMLTRELWAHLGPDLKVYFVTARSDDPVVIQDTYDWLEHNTDHFDDVFHVQNKAEFCKLAGIQVMIEDEVRQVVGLLEAGVDVILPDQPWNQHLPDVEKGRLTRVYNWREMVEVAKEYFA